MPNFNIGTINGFEPRQTDVDTASKTILAGSPTGGTTRVGIVLTNLSDGTIYLAFGAYAAVVGSGIPLLGSGGNWSMDEFSYTKESIQAIAHSNNAHLAIQEFYV